MCSIAGLIAATSIMIFPDPWGIAGKEYIYTISNKSVNINQQFSVDVGSENINVSGSSNVTPLSGDTNEEKIWTWLVGYLGLSEAGAAGILGNFYAESGFDPWAVENANQAGFAAVANKVKSGCSVDEWKSAVDSYGGSGYGLAQWSFTRKDDLWNYAVNTAHTDVTDLETQLKFMEFEITTGYDGVLDAMKNATDPQDAAFVWHEQYEKSSQSRAAIQKWRLDPAQEIYDRYKGKSLSTSSNSSNKTFTAASDWQKWILANYQNFLDIPYQYSGSDPNIALDCSHYVDYVINQALKATSSSLTYSYTPSSSMASSWSGKEVSLDNAQPGDVVRWSGHAAIYMGTVNGKEHQVLTTTGSKSTIEYDKLPTVKDISKGGTGSYTIYHWWG